MKKNSGQKLYTKAKKIIPGGNMLLSKRPENFLPDIWPAYYSSSKGCEVTDLDNNTYTDISIMGIGTNILGYGNEAVDEAVMSSVKKGVSSTLNCPEEVQLAEELLNINPWAKMVRFCRTGGELNAMSIRLARASTGRDKIAFCGYHGWHDWYLSANLVSNNELNELLLPGLEPKGVPKNLKGSSIPFEYNNFDALKKIMEDNKGQIAAIKMEVFRNVPPKDDYLKKVRELATEHRTVLIFDECTSGFRETYGGLYSKYNVEPDLILYSKALGNGYAISALVGIEEVMEEAQSTFISSTFWTERIGPTAAIATLNQMKKIESWKIISDYGKKIQEGWKDIASSNDIKISIQGLPALSNFSFLGKNSNIYKTFITQHMLKKSYLASNLVYLSTAHSEAIINNYFDILDEGFKIISKVEKDHQDPTLLLDGKQANIGFARLN